MSHSDLILAASAFLKLLELNLYLQEGDIQEVTRFEQRNQKGEEGGQFWRIWYHGLLRKEVAKFLSEQMLLTFSLNVML